MFLSWGCDPNYSIRTNTLSQIESQNTLLHIAAYNGNIHAVKILLNAGAKIDSRNRLGYTPLHVAAKNGFMQIIYTLLRYGANVKIVTPGGKNAEMIALENHRTEIVDLIYSAQLNK